MRCSEPGHRVAVVSGVEAEKVASRQWQSRTCLFSLTEHDLRSRLRSDASDEAVQKYLKSVVLQKEDRHHIGEPEFVQP